MKCFSGRKSVVLGVWGGPGAPETLQKGGGEAPRPNEMATEAPGAPEAIFTPLKAIPKPAPEAIFTPRKLY